MPNVIILNIRNKELSHFGNTKQIFNKSIKFFTRKTMIQILVEMIQKVTHLQTQPKMLITILLKEENAYIHEQLCKMC